MKEQIINSVVKDVTTKKKYVKPDFEVIELKMEAPLLMGSGGTANADGQAIFGNSGALSTSSWGSND
ncbi:MAG: hypothetical protein II937_05730 [Bacteroidales bacterium]|nr:hypothetical protein [Bacteroidales bacterium]